MVDRCNNHVEVSLRQYSGILTHIVKQNRGHARITEICQLLSAGFQDFFTAVHPCHADLFPLRQTAPDTLEKQIFNLMPGQTGTVQLIDGLPQ